MYFGRSGQPEEVVRSFFWTKFPLGAKKNLVAMQLGFFYSQK